MPFKPGQSGNLAGRTVTELTLKKHLNDALDRQLPVDHPAYVAGLTAREILAQKALDIAIHTENELVFKAMFETVRDTTEGKPTQTANVNVTEMPQPILGGLSGGDDDSE